MIKISKKLFYIFSTVLIICGMLLVVPGPLYAVGNFNYSPADLTLNIVAGTSQSFYLTLTAPKKNGDFSVNVAKEVASSIPDEWVSVSPASLSFHTTDDDGDFDTWTITITVPLSAATGSYSAKFKAHSSGSGPGESNGMDLTVNVSAPATSTTYTVTYYGNTNTGGTAPVDTNSPYASGATVTILDNTDLAKTGFIFSGWNTSADGSGTGYVAANTFAILANTDLYAQWTPVATGGGVTVSAPAITLEVLALTTEEEVEEPVFEETAVEGTIEVAGITSLPFTGQSTYLAVLGSIMLALGLSIMTLMIIKRRKTNAIR
ncbi:MAG: InlB B-repeat-containing protein [Candidatus Humimicrobiaceae bacterium]